VFVAKFLEEIRRRNVARVAIAYFAASWLFVQIAETVLPAFGYGAVAVRTLIILLAIGFVPAVIA
jgi:adenylate cyclase